MSGTSPCYICGAPMTELSLDPRDMKTKPCSHCLAIIDDAANAMEDDDFVSFVEDDPSDLVEAYRELGDLYD